MFDISLTGDKTLQKKLNSLDRRLQTKAMKAAMKESMEPVKSFSKAIVREDTGLLRKSIRIAARANRKGAFAYLRTGTRKQLKIPADAKYYYPAAIEYGTRYFRARSFLRLALGTKRNQVISIFSKQIRFLLERS